MHPVLTFGLPTRDRRMGGLSVKSDLDGDIDLFCGRDILAKGSIGNFAPGDVTVELL
jgi:small ligand-binding sensory domain FIST